MVGSPNFSSGLPVRHAERSEASAVAPKIVKSRSFAQLRMTNIGPHRTSPAFPKNGCHCSGSGGAVNRLTPIRLATDVASAGKIMGTIGSRLKIFQATATTVPAAIELRPPAVVVRFQKNAATTTGVTPAPYTS